MPISYTMSVLYYIIRLYLLKHMLIPYNVACNIVAYNVTYYIACLGLCLLLTCSWSAHRSCPMILGPAWWSVLHYHSPDALSLSLACTANVSGDRQPCTSKNRNFKFVTRWHCWWPGGIVKANDWAVGYMTPCNTGCAWPGCAAGRGELGEWLLKVDIQQGPVSQSTEFKSRLPPHCNHVLICLCSCKGMCKRAIKRRLLANC